MTLVFRGTLNVWSLASLARGSQIPRGSVEDGALFDYIVVGAGAAGSAVAARLALAGNSVLLVEAGGRPGLLTKIPYAAFALLGSDIDWFYETIPNNKSCLSSRGRQCRFSRGRCLGGSTSINYMMYVRGNPQDYDYKIPGWSWKDMKPYFLRYEGLQSLHRFPPSSQIYHNTNGEVEISLFDESNNPWRRRITNAFMSLNFPHNSDVNAKSQIGVTQIAGYLYKGERVTAATAYLYKQDVRENLIIASNMRCTGVIIDENKVARGVTVVRDGNNRTLKLYVRQEVILSAGTVGSAQLLMLSGIGPRKHLRELGIPVNSDLPVGENMSDHVLPLIFIKVDQVFESAPNLSYLGVITLQAIQWLLLHNGPLASLGVSDIMAFANINCYDFIKRQLRDNGPECDVPTHQIIFIYVDRYLLNFGQQSLKNIFNGEFVDQILKANRDGALLAVSPIILQPKSRGWIRLASKDPFVPPTIMPNYLDDDRDVQEIVKSIQIIEQMLQTPAFTKQNASLLRLQFSDCPRFGQTGYWECYVRHMSNSVYHAVGTAAIGTVLDERFRVRGVKKLRVGDASVLPRVPRGNTAAACFAVGERLADFLLEDNIDL